MATTFITPGCGAENVLIHDTNIARRSALGAHVVKMLLDQGWTVFVFAGVHTDVFAEFVNCNFVRKHMPIDMSDAQEVCDAVKVHGDRVAVVLGGLLAPGGSAVNRLLNAPNIYVLSMSSVRAVRGDHRYSRVWTSGKEWATRSEPKGFAVVQPEPSTPCAPPADWLSWAGRLLKVW